MVSVATEVANKKWRPRIATLYGAPQAIPPSHPIWYFRRRVLLSSAGRMTDPRICVLHPRMQHRLGHLQIHVLHLPALLCMTHDWHVQTISWPRCREPSASKLVRSPSCPLLDVLLSLSLACEL